MTDLEEMLHQAAEDGNVITLSSAIRNGADVNSRDANGGTALLSAIWRNREGCVKILLAHGADFETKCAIWGMTPLFDAAKYGSIECMRVLIDHGVEVNARSKNGVTALMCAASNGNSECVRLLLNAGAFTDLIDDSGKTALDHVSPFNDVETEGLLRAWMERESISGPRPGISTERVRRKI